MSLGILSWNIGKKASNNQERIHILLDEFFKKCGENKQPDILVIGFQELPPSSNVKKHLDSFQKVKTEYEFICQAETCNSYKIKTSCPLPPPLQACFAIRSFVYAKCPKPPPQPPKPCPLRPSCKVNKSCPKTTKGYVLTKLEISGNLIYIVNTHMPFQDLNTTNNFVDEMFKKLKLKDETNLIIFGDLNSRSLLSSDCYKKELPLCEENSNEKYCTIIRKLNNTDCINTENPSANNETSDGGAEEALYGPEEYDGFETREVEEFGGFENGKSVGGGNSVDHCGLGLTGKYDTDKIDEKKLIDILIKTDSLQLVKGLKNDFKDAKALDFLPTYKRASNTGCFKLKKGDQGRLPGYADRIIYKTKSSILNNAEVYSPLRVTGNDHLPIMALFNLNLTTSGGSRFLKKSRGKKLRKRSIIKTRKYRKRNSKSRSRRKRIY